MATNSEIVDLQVELDSSKAHDERRQNFRGKSFSSFPRIMSRGSDNTFRRFDTHGSRRLVIFWPVFQAAHYATTSSNNYQKLLRKYEVLAEDHQNLKLDHEQNETFRRNLQKSCRDFQKQIKDRVRPALQYTLANNTKNLLIIP